MTIKNLHANLSLAYNFFSKQYNIVNPFFEISPNGKLLTWKNYKSKESFYNYEEYFHWVNENLQYSIAISETAFIQVFFEEEDGVISKGSLSFLPYPDLLMVPFRFDMDTKNCKDYYHNSYHINFGYRSDDVRFSLNRFPFPTEFIKFCLFLNGNSEFTHFNKKKFFNDLTAIGELYSHLFDFEIA